MAYQALARKWRPRRFCELVGQEHVVRALMHAVEQDRLHHAYLFSGTRGVGKTTLARILAKAINCEQREGSEPCGVCAVCKEVDEGRFVDLLEVDAASKTKVEDTRELLENVIYAPTHARYKIYLIDEVHMLSAHSFNALLKTLEEPPAHVKFLLATTDPQKVPVTVLSRCLQFNLKQLTPEQIRGQLESVLVKESIPFEANAVKALARAADGSLRDGLSLLDQAIAHGGGRVLDGRVLDMLGAVSRAPVFEMLQDLIALDAKALLARITELDAYAPNYAEVIQELLGIIHQASIAQWAPEALEGEDDAAMILALSKQIRPEDLQLFYQIALLGQRDLSLNPDARMGFEMMMLRMLAFRPLGASESSLPHAGEAKPETHEAKPAKNAKAATPEKSPEMADCEPQQKVATPRIQSPKVIDRQAEGVVPDGGWMPLVESLGLSAMARELANNSTLLELSDEVCRIALSRRLEHLKSPRAFSALQESLRTHLAKPLVLKIELEDTEPSETPALKRQRAEETRKDAASKAVEEDRVILALKETFDAHIVQGSIQSKDS